MLGEHRPARTVVPVAGLHYGYLVEMDAIAVVRDS
jgi:enamine deaminase RidA (YjgF/YER057c/UK114 family)